MGDVLSVPSLPPTCLFLLLGWGAAIASTMLTPVRPSAKQHTEEFRMINRGKKLKPLLPVFIFIHACALHPDTV